MAPLISETKQANLQRITNLFRLTSFYGDKNKLTQEEHEKNLSNLIQNLNDPHDIVLKVEQTYLTKMVPIKNIYTKEELQQLDKIKKFEQEPEKVDNYFQWKNYKLPVNLFEASVFYYQHGLDTLKNPEKIKDKAIIDVGCHIADSVLIFRDYFKNNPIYSFEPSKLNYETALKTLELNSISGVKIENIGLGDSDEELKINSTDNLLKSCENNISEEGNETIKITTLDKYVEENNIDVGLIKVDIEGFEQNFLKGAYKTIKEQKPVLLISIYHNYNDFYKIKPMIENWNLGYTFSLFQGIQNSGKIEVETLLICEQS